MPNSNSHGPPLERDVGSGSVSAIRIHDVNTSIRLLRAILGYFALACVAPLGAQVDDVPTIREVRISGADGLEEERVIGRIALHPGEPYSTDAVAAALQRLLSWPAIARARIDRVVVEDEGVTLEFHVVPHRRLEVVRILGNEVTPRGDLEDVVQLEPGSSLSDLDVEEARERLLNKLHEDGFLFAEVRAALLPHPLAPLNTELIFRIREGLRVTIASLEIHGNTVFSNWKIRAAIRHRPRILFGFISRGFYRPSEFEADLERIRALYREHGYLDVIVQRGDLKTREGNREIELNVIVEEGSRYKIGEVRLDGHSEAIEQPLLDRISIEPGEFYDARRLEETRRRLTSYYQANLFRSPVVEVEHVYHLGDRANVVDIVFQIDERRHFYSGRIDVTGNERTRDHVIRNRLDATPLAPITNVQLQDSADALRSLGLGYFEFAAITTTPSDAGDVVVAESNGEIDPVDVEDVTVHVKEKTEGEFFVSGGASSGRGAIAAIGIRKPNFDIFDWPGGKRGWKRPFTGGGQYLSVEVLPGTRNSQFNVLFREPHFFNSSHSFSITGFSDIFDWRDFDETHVGGDLGVRRYWDDERHWSSRLAWVIEDIEVDNFDSDADPFFRQFSGHTFYSYPSLRLNYLDVSFDPYSGDLGLRIETRADLALDETGSETEFIRSLTSVDYDLDLNYWVNRLFFDETAPTSVPSMAHVLHLGGRFGWMEGIQGDDVPFFEKFFLGGPRSFRGFDYRGVGPQIDDIPIGEETFWRGSVAYSFPVFIPELRLQAIFDFGDIQPRLSDYSVDTLRTSAGVGLLLRIPIPLIDQLVPVNIYFVEALKKERGDEDRVFTFTLGFDF